MPYRVVASTPEVFALKLNDGKPMLILIGMISAVGLPALFFAEGTIYEKAFWCVMAIGFLCWIAFLLRHTPASVSVSSADGVHIITRGPWGGEFHIEKGQVQCLKIDLQVLPRIRRGVVWAIVTTGPPVPVIGFNRRRAEDSLGHANRYAEEFTQRIPVPVMPYDTN